MASPLEEDREWGVGEGVMPGGSAGFWEVPTRVDDDVLGQVAHVDEGFVADRTFVGPDVVVVTDVVGQLARLDEPLGVTPQSPQSTVSPWHLHPPSREQHPAAEGKWRCPHPTFQHHPSAPPGIPKGNPHLFPHRSHT